MSTFTAATRSHISKPALCIIAALVLLSLAVGSFFIRRELAYQAVVHRYPVGTKAQTVLDDYRGSVTLRDSGVVLPQIASIPGVEPTELQDVLEGERRKQTIYIIEIPSANAELDFNFYKELIKVRKLSRLRMVVYTPH